MRAGVSLMLLLAGLVLAGCEKVNDNEDCGCNGTLQHPVLFEYRYVNFAWGYQEHGWLIDSEGNRKLYNMPDDYRLPDSTGMISREDLLHNFSLADSTLQSVEKNDIETYSALIPGASEGELSEPRNIAADAGSSVLSCFLYVQDADAYKYVFLAQSGDWEQFNLASEAEVIAEWMVGLGVFWISN
jgi:hypothetical protein